MVSSRRPAWFSETDRGDGPGEAWLFAGTVIGLVATLLHCLDAVRAQRPERYNGRPDQGHYLFSIYVCIIDSKNVPDFISGLGRDGQIVGYIPRAYLVPPLANDPLGSNILEASPQSMRCSNKILLVICIQESVSSLIRKISRLTAWDTHRTTFAQARRRPGDD